MKKSWKLGMGIAAALGVASPVMAADHQDGTITGSGPLADPTVDITDVYSWMSSDSKTINFVLNVNPNATSTSLFSTAAKYVLHTTSSAGASGILATTATKRDIICTFAGSTAPQTASCWVTDGGTNVAEYATGNASVATTPVASADGKLKFFAGPRNDPFFFNLAGFKNATSAVAAAIKATVAGGGTSAFIGGFDGNGCPYLTTAARGVGTYLTKDCSGSAAGVDAFRVPTTLPNADCLTPPMYVTTQAENESLTGDVLSIVIQVDKSVLTLGGSNVSVWGATTH